jgi:hypothetical protein
VDPIINKRTIQSLVNLGVLHNFLKTEVAKELELRVSPCGVTVKEVNSKEKAAAGVASQFTFDLTSEKVRLTSRL